MKKNLFIIFNTFIFMIAFIGSSQAIPIADDMDIMPADHKKTDSTFIIESNNTHPPKNLTRFATSPPRISTIENKNVHPTILFPEPPTLLLLVTGLAFILTLRRKNSSRS